MAQSLLKNIYMSLPRANYDPRRVCLNPFPEFTLGPHRRTLGVYLAGGLVRSAKRWTRVYIHVHSIHSSRLLIGHFWMLQFCPSMPKHLMERLLAQTRLCISPLLTGSQAYVRYSATLLSTSSTKIGYVEKKDSATQRQCGGQDCYCSSGSP